MKTFFSLSRLKSMIQSKIFISNNVRGKSYKGCPFILTMKALRPFIMSLDYTDKVFTIQFAEQIRNALTSRLDNLSENEIKELDKDILKETIDVMKNYIHVIDPVNAD